MKDQGLTEHYEMENLRRKKEGKLRAGAGAEAQEDSGQPSETTCFKAIFW